jgi:glutamine amidotransferase-like uncharacterized protein
VPLHVATLIGVSRNSGGEYIPLVLHSFCWQPTLTICVCSVVPHCLLCALCIGFDYQTEAGAVAADVQFAVPPALLQQLQQQGSPLIQQVNSSSWCFTHDYSNGGPFFVTQDRQLDLSALPDVQVLATYCALPDRHNILPSNQQQQRLRQQQQQSGLAHDKVAGLQAAAAVRCRVGSGVALLCGTHPELEPQWLDVCGLSTERPRASSSGSTTAAVQTVTALTGSRGSAAATAAARSVDSSRSAQPALAVLDNAAAAGLSMLQQRHERQEAAAGSSITSTAGQSLKSCEDVQLAQHTEALRRVLAASQEQRELFLSCLLYEVLRRG